MDKDITGFLVRAKQAIFAGEVAKMEPSRPNSKDFQYVEGNLKYIDTYLGSANFAGEEAMWKDDIPFWSMNYIGKTLSEESQITEIFRFLTEALLLVPEEYPFRGPQHYTNGDYSYKCTIKGDFHWFSGIEEIFYKNDKVYELTFHGGDVK
ncbi:MAG: DUF5680 domain-containing protein [Defluviitaleaceae bacterium]|nr:DUF5680 domain-containing protein [Defluviitaleaceae bacterium]